MGNMIKQFKQKYKTDDLIPSTTLKNCNK